MNGRVRSVFASARGVFWLAQLAGWGAYGLSTFLTLLPSLPPGTRGSYLAVKLARAAVGLAASLILFRAYRALLARRAPPLATLGVALLLCSALGVAWLLVYRQGIAPALLRDPPPFGWNEFPRAALDLTFVLLAWSGIYLGARSWRVIQEQERDVARARTLAEEARFRTLSYQLNPHFLFNSLSSVRALIGEDDLRAREMVTAFAELLRYTLTRDPASRVTLGEEMEIVERYLSIEAIRFEERLHVSTRVSPAATSCRIPVFLVHPLVENAVKHGARAPGGPLRVRLSASVDDDRLRLEVANTGALRNGGSARAASAPREETAGTGIGWANIRARLEHLHPGDHRFEVAEEEGWVRVAVELPALRPQRESLHVA